MEEGSLVQVSGEEASDLPRHHESGETLDKKGSGFCNSWTSEGLAQSPGV